MLTAQKGGFGSMIFICFFKMEKDLARLKGSLHGLGHMACKQIGAVVLVMQH